MLVEEERWTAPARDILRFHVRSRPGVAYFGAGFQNEPRIGRGGHVLTPVAAPEPTGENQVRERTICNTSPTPCRSMCACGGSTWTHTLMPLPSLDSWRATTLGRRASPLARMPAVAIAEPDGMGGAFQHGARRGNIPAPHVTISHVRVRGTPPLRRKNDRGARLMISQSGTRDRGNGRREVGLTVSVDTEEDNWIPATRDVTTGNVTEVWRLAAFFKRLGVRATYFTTYQVAVASEVGECNTRDFRHRRCRSGSAPASLEYSAFLRSRGGGFDANGVSSGCSRGEAGLPPSDAPPLPRRRRDFLQGWPLRDERGYPTASDPTGHPRGQQRDPSAFVGEIRRSFLC